MKSRRIARVFETSGQLSVPNLIEVCRPIVLRGAITREPVTSQDYGVPIVREYILNFLMKCTARDGHGFGRKFVHTLPAWPNTGNAATARHFEREVGSAFRQIPVNVAASEGGVGFSDDVFQRVQHVAGIYHICPRTRGRTRPNRVTLQRAQEAISNCAGRAVGSGYYSSKCNSTT